MRHHSWRLLLLRCHLRPQQLHISRHFSLLHSNPVPNRHFSSLLRSYTLFASQTQDLRIHGIRCFSSSELAIERDSDHAVVLIDIFTRHSRTSGEIELELDSNKVVITHELVLKVLRSLSTAPDVARRFFDWVSEKEGERLSSKSYNLMLGIFGSNGYVKEFWDLVGTMKKKGYGVSKGTYDRVSEKFEKEGFDSDLEKLKELYASGSVDNSVDKICSRVCKVIRGEVWGHNVEKCLSELKIAYSTDLVAMVLGRLGTEPNKALIFFRWIQESSLFKHDELTYNAMVRVLGREDCIDKFWRVVNEMRGEGHDLLAKTYVEVLQRFVHRRMMKDAVDLYEFASCGANKPLIEDCTFLLRKIVTSKDIDMDLFQKVVRTFSGSGNVLSSSTFDAVLKSLISVGRVGECNKILKAMKEGGLLPSDTLLSKIAFELSRRRKKEEASEFMDDVEASGCNINYKTLSSLVDGYCVAGDFEEASNCFQKMVEKAGTSHAGYAWHSTYKLLISKFLARGGFEKALTLLDMMKAQGFPPFLDPFIEFISKNGTADQALTFLNAMTVKRFPSIPVFERVFEAYLNAGRHDEAHNLLSKCPRHIGNNADVLNLFSTMSSASTSIAA
ncbi:hypothetical protein NMG60_11006259 [Bertholletia excelsa]